MSTLSFTDSRLWPTAGWTMLHVFWIGLLIGGTGLALRPLIRQLSARKRYLVALGWFTLLAVSPLPIGWWVVRMGYGQQAAGNRKDTPIYTEATRHLVSAVVERPGAAQAMDVQPNASTDLTPSPLAGAILFGTGFEG